MKIAIIGSGPTEQLAPWDDDSWSFWTLAFRDTKRSDAMFEVHARPKWQFHSGPDYPQKLAKATAPVYLLQEQADIPNAIAYPFGDVKSRLAPAGAEADFFTSSIAYMMALAVWTAFDEANGVEEIGLFGADMCAEDEYGYQRPSMCYLVALARGRGIKVTVPPTSPLLRANFTYGTHLGAEAFQQAAGLTQDVLHARLVRYQKKREEAQVQMNSQIAIMNTLDGIVDELKALIAAVGHFNRGGTIPDA